LYEKLAENDVKQTSNQLIFIQKNIHSYSVKYDEFQGWTMDNYIDEKSKATIEKMLQEEQYYLNGQNRRRNIRSLSSTTHKQPWSEDEKNLFLKGLVCEKISS
jgi:hypothetical protein